MILLTLGTCPHDFKRLVKIIDELVEEKVIKEDIFGQIGYSSYIPRNFEYKNLIPKEEFTQMFESCNFVISHAGMGSIKMAIDSNKKLIAFPRMKKFKEHVNNHQIDTANRFESMNHILSAHDKLSLCTALNKIEKFTPEIRKANPENIAEHIDKFILEN